MLGSLIKLQGSFDTILKKTGHPKNNNPIAALMIFDK